MNADVDYCRRNDKYGLYKLANEGKLDNIAGVDEVYDKPGDTDFTIIAREQINIEKVISII